PSDRAGPFRNLSRYQRREGLRPIQIVRPYLPQMTRANGIPQISPARVFPENSRECAAHAFDLTPGRLPFKGQNQLAFFCPNNWKEKTMDVPVIVATPRMKRLVRLKFMARLLLLAFCWGRTAPGMSV